jgi:phospholipid N-methyltransferase
MVRDTVQFLGAFVRHPSRVGAIAPSSAALARAMVAGLEVGDGGSVLEFGPGTGSFTAAIADVLVEPTHYLGIEREPGFVELLRRRFDRLQFVHGSAEDARSHHAEAQLPPVRAILCGLPFACLAPSVQDGIIAALDQLLGPGGEFRTFQYLHAYCLPTAVRFRQRIAGVLGSHRRSPIVLANMPPAYVLRWRRD